MVAVTNAGAGTGLDSGSVPTSEAVSALSSLIRRWHGDIVHFASASFTADPSGNPVFIDPKQSEILLAVQNHDKVAIRTARGVGKTASCAITVHWWLATRFPALVLTSAGIWDHLKYKLWPEIRNWGSNWILRDAFDYLSLEMRSLEYPDKVRAFSATSDDPEHVEGGHSPHLLIAIDEAKSMPEDVYSALLGSLTNAGHGEEQKIVAYSTPPLNGAGWFTRVSTSSDWHTVHVSGLDSPRVSRTFIDEIVKEFGEDSPEYQSFVLGEIPESIDETLIQLRWFEAAQERGIPVDRDGLPTDRRRPVVTCDVAREGSDLTIIGAFQHGKWGLVRFDDDGRWGWFAHQDEMATASRLSVAAKQLSACAIIVDATGAGGGVVDRLRQLQSERLLPASCSIVPVNFGEAAERPDRFELKKDELWWQGRNAIKSGLISVPSNEEIRAYHLPRGTDFKSQFTTPIYEYNHRDRINILDKREGNREKTRALPTKSPDCAHSFILGVRYYLRQPQVPRSEEPPKTPEEALGRVMQKKIADEAKKRRGGGGNPFLR